MKEISFHLHNPSFFSYQDFFSADSIIEYLCHQRMSYSRKAHEQGYFDRLTPGKSNKEIPQDILRFMPPRARWIRAPKRKRKSKKKGNQYASDLCYTVKCLRKKNGSRDRSWILAQDKLIESVRRRAFNPTPEQPFKPPEIRPQQKAPSRDEYRVIGHYNNTIEEAILIGQCANYLRQVFECYFYPCSFAFRASMDRKSPPPTQHDAFEKLAEFWTKHQKDGRIQAYAVECDIQGFYDTVDHVVVLRCYDNAINELSQKGIDVDARAKTVIVNYLNSYSYNGYGRPQALSLLRENTDSNRVKNRNETIRHLHGNVECIKYGILQGGALSNFFANLLLHDADKAVLKVIEAYQDVTTYVRYCDDMILVGLEEKIIAEAAQKYIETLKKLKLAHHPLKPLQYTEEKQSQREFWKGKSKSTYQWKKKGQSQSWVPWLAFVGYHLRYDGLVRIRPDSLKKEHRKQMNLTNRFLDSVRRGIEGGKSKSIKELLSSLEYRLRASAIGRQHEWDLSLKEPEYCWFAGFRGLTSPSLPPNQPIARTQLRQLDRGLGHQLARARNVLSKYSDLETQTPTKKSQRRLKFLGKPRSYSGQLPDPDGESCKR